MTNPSDRLIPRGVRPIDEFHDEMMAKAAADHQKQRAAQPPADRAALRDRIADILRPHANLGGAPLEYALPFFDGTTPSLPRISGWKPLEDVADAVLAVLPELTPTVSQTAKVDRLSGELDDSRRVAEHYMQLAADRLASLEAITTDRAAVLREAADELGRMDFDTDSTDYGYDTYRDAWNGGVMDAAEELRRMADETPAAACGRPASMATPCSAGDHCCKGPAGEAHVVADGSDDLEHVDDCPGCEAFTLTGHVAAPQDGARPSV